VTRLGDKVRVIPLDTGRLARVEENVLAAARDAGRPAPARPRRSAAIAWTAAGAALAAAAAFLFVGRGDPGDRTPARVDLGDAAILLTPGSRASVGTRPDGARLVELTSGRVDCEVEPRPGRAPFVVQAGDVTVEVVGTVFSVERASRGDDVKVAVSRGVVRVATRGRPPVELAAGQSWSRRVDEVVASSGSQPNTSPDGKRGAHSAQRVAAGAAASPGDPTSSLAGADGDPASSGGAEAIRPGGRGNTGPSGDGTATGRPGERGDGTATGRPAERGDGTNTGTGRPGDGTGTDRPGDRGDGTGTGRPGDRGDGTGTGRPVHRGDGTGTGRPGDRGDGASGSRTTDGRAGGRTGRHGASAEDPGANAAAPDDLPPLTCEDVDRCRRAALGSVGASAGEALYSLIYIELFREKDPGQAITLAELYERRFARRRAREAEAVLWLRVIAHGAAGEPTERREAARRYLERHPRGRFSADAARLLGE
jgi:hypothetical protein